MEVVMEQRRRRRDGARGRLSAPREAEAAAGLQEGAMRIVMEVHGGFCCSGHGQGLCGHGADVAAQVTSGSDGEISVTLEGSPLVDGWTDEELKDAFAESFRAAQRRVQDFPYVVDGVSP